MFLLKSFSLVVDNGVLMMMMGSEYLSLTVRFAIYGILQSIHWKGSFTVPVHGGSVSAVSPASFVKHRLRKSRNFETKEDIVADWSHEYTNCTSVNTLGELTVLLAIKLNQLAYRFCVSIWIT